MPYRKPYFRKRTYRRRRRYGGGGGFASGYRAIAKHTNWPTVWGAIKDIKSLMNVERKFFDEMQVNQAIGTTAAVYPLSQIGTGDTYNTREGLSIKCISHLLRLTAVMNVSAEQTFVRLIIFRDEEQRSSTPTGSEVLEVATDYLSPINHVNGRRFTIMRDHTINLTKTYNAKLYKNFSKAQFHVKYSGVNSTDTKEGNLYLLIITDQSTDTPLIDFDSRLRYVDN